MGVGGSRLQGPRDEPFLGLALSRVHLSSEAKSDPGDAEVLAGMVRGSAHKYRETAGDPELAEAEISPGLPVHVLDPGRRPTVCGRRCVLNSHTPSRQKSCPLLPPGSRSPAVEVDYRIGSAPNETCRTPGDPIISGAFGAGVAASARVIDELNRQINELKETMAWFRLLTLRY